MGRILAIVIVLALGGTSQAETPQKSETTALGLSLGGTAVSYAALATLALFHDEVPSSAYVAAAIGVVVSPSLGHWYAGGGVMTRGLGMRVGGIGLAMLGGLVAGLSCMSSHGTCDPILGASIAAAGGGLYVWGTVHDIATARAHVRDRNAPRFFHIVPTVQQRGGGVSLAGSF